MNSKPQLASKINSSSPTRPPEPIPYGQFKHPAKDEFKFGQKETERSHSDKISAGSFQNNGRITYRVEQ